MSKQRQNGAPELLRIQYADGAKLRGKDLRTVRDDAPARLGLHVLAPHGTWGVASGLRVNITAGGLSASVTPGAAFNCRGRALLLGRTAQLDAVGPALAGRLLEAVIGPASEESECGRFFGPEGCPPYDSKPHVAGRVRWAPVGGPVEAPGGATWCGRRTEEVALGQFQVGKNGDLSQGHLTGRSVAQTRAWAKSGHGAVTLGSLSWTAMSGGWIATVDTEAAGFTATPAYVVSIPDWPVGGQSVPPVIQLVPGGGTPSKSAFRVGLIWGTRAGEQPIGALNPGTYLGDTKMHWTGVQGLQGCPLFFGPLVVLPLGVSTIMGGFLSV